MKNKILFWIGGAGIVAIVDAFLLPTFSASEIAEKILLPLKKENPITLMFVGDIMLSRNIGSIIERNGPLYPFAKIASTTRRADVTFGNLENPVSLRGEDRGSIYSFRAHPDTLEGLQFAGFDIVSLANNHIADWGDEALIDSLFHVRSRDMIPIGIGNTQEEARSPGVIRIHGKEVCMLSYSQFAGWYGKDGSSPSIAPFSEEVITEDIVKAKSLCDLIIVTIHWGEEYETRSNEIQKQSARLFIDTGAHMVIGHHPHVLQEVEEYNGGIIAYSLGNFIFDQNFSPDTRRSAILEVVFFDNRLSFSLIPIAFSPTYQPYEVY